MQTHSCMHVHQWQSLLFKIREADTYFYEHGLISITAYWMTVIHIPFTQLNVTSIGLGYDIILKFDLHPSWSLQIKVYNVGAQLETKI
jgi:hypothetical protein